MPGPLRIRPPPAADCLWEAGLAILATIRQPEVCGPEVVAFLIGSAATKLYTEFVKPYSHNYRSPNDIDVVICTSLTQETLKERIAAAHQNVHLIPSKTPGMDYHVLRYGTQQTIGLNGGYSKLIKIDVLVADYTLGIPSIPRGRVASIMAHGHIWPVAPLSFLFLLRLQGWDDHKHALLEHHREKMLTDTGDLSVHLVPFALATSFAPGRACLWEEAASYLPPEFLALSEARAARFVEDNPWARDDWRRLGFRFYRPYTTTVSPMATSLAYCNLSKLVTGHKEVTGSSDSSDTESSASTHDPIH